VARAKLPDPVNSVVYSPDGRRVATASGFDFKPFDNKAAGVHLWNADNAQLLRRFRKNTSYQPAAWSVAFSPDGKRIAAGELFPVDPSVWIWDSESGHTVTILKGSSRISGVAFSSDGKRLFSVSSDRSLRIWDLDRSGLLLKYSVPDCFYRLYVSPDGSKLYAGSGYCQTPAPVQMWEARSHYPADAVEIIEDLQKRYPLVSELSQHLSGDSVTDKRIRDQALQLLEGKADNSLTFFEQVMVPLLAKNQSADNYRRALRRAEDAVRRAPYCATYLLAVALGHDRTGGYTRALAAMNRVRAMGELSSEEMIVLSAVQFRIGQIEQAGETLREAKESIKETGFSPRESWITFKSEVEEMLDRKNEVK
jgi:hypothetical protein